MATTHPRLPHDTTRPPACSWRGLLVDSARTFWPVPTMELLLAVMARYRFNVLHWHLTDNTGWRMRVPGYPMLTAIGGNIPRQPSDWYDTECAPGRTGSTDWGPWESDLSLMRAGLTSGAAIERLFIDRALRTLHFHGRRAAAWDTLTRAYPTPPPGTTLLAHRPGNAGRRAAESSGAPWILADADILTLSHPGRTNSPLEPAHALFDDLTQALHGERLKGVEAVAWSSSVTTPDLLFYHLLPRLLVVAEAAWHGDDSLPWDKLAPLVEHEMTHLRRTIPYWNPQRP